MRRGFIIVWFLILSIQIAYGQSNPDSVFQVARELATSSRYSQALEILEPLCENYPSNSDYALYAARVHYWSKSFNKSRQFINRVYDSIFPNKEAIDLLISVDLADEKYAQVLENSQTGLEYFSENSHHYYLMQAIALDKLDRNKEALLTLEKIEDSEPNKKDADYIKTQILKQNPNQLTIGHVYSGFDDENMQAWNVSQVEYSRILGRYTQIVRFNFGSMFDQRNSQIEADGYLRFNNAQYIYLNAGLSQQSSIFPYMRFGAEYYKDFSKWSSSLGGRYLYFDEANSLTLLTGHLAYTNENMWTFNYRPFVQVEQDATLFSHLVYFKKTFETKESFVQLDFQYGNLPYYFLTNDIFSRVSAFRVGLNSKWRIADHYFVQPAVMFEREETAPDNFRNRYIAQILFSWRF